jgi:FkbM family methyltransferase
MSYHLEEIITPHGARGVLAVRDGTSDLSIALSTLSAKHMRGDDEYRLRRRDFKGTFVDVGAHIGAVSLAVLLDHPITAILVEPVAENVELLRATIRANDLSRRAMIIEAAVGTDTIRVGSSLDDRWVANLGYNDGETRKVSTVTLPYLVALSGGHIDSLKTDCEGGEWGLFASGGLADVDYIFGEWHGHNRDYVGPRRLHLALDETHDVIRITDQGGIGLFEAVRR